MAVTKMQLVLTNSSAVRTNWSFEWFRFESKSLVQSWKLNFSSKKNLKTPGLGGPGPPLPRFVDHSAANQQTWSPRRRQTSSDGKSHTTSITTIHNISMWSNHFESKKLKDSKNQKDVQKETTTWNRRRVNESRSRLKNKMTEDYGDQRTPLICKNYEPLNWCSWASYMSVL